jgi:two-component system chemotaxis sensor kinase CheA
MLSFVIEGLAKLDQSMEINFDISEDELPVFLAEADEHLQVLDDVLIRLERESSDADLVQTVFRSAHTIKGMSGMIGHQRMTDLTHALENLLDAVRKKNISITKELIDICLEAVDRLRLLRDEVVTSQRCDLNIDEAVKALKEFNENAKREALQTNEPGAVKETPPQKKEEPREAANAASAAGQQVKVRAQIDVNSMASAARAFQLMLALQEIGEIQSMTPSQAQIETSSPVSDFFAVVATTHPFEKMRAALLPLSGINQIYLDDKPVLPNGAAADVSQTAASSPQEEKPKADPPVPGGPRFSNGGVINERRAATPFGRRSADMTIRTNVERLDALMNLVGEMITDRNHLKQIHSRLLRVNSNYDEIFETIAHLGRITDQLQEEVMRIRMLPVSSTFGKFPRMVRDMADKIGKKIDLVMRGEDTEMDRSMIEEINDPLIHLIRNSVDHGIEPPDVRRAAGKPERGTLTLTARHEQGRIILTVEDDGGGIDGEKLRRSAIQKGLITAEEAAGLTEEQSVDLMFMAGLSTAQKVTDISGRGVGLDIVNTNIQRVNGTIQVETKLGLGTKFQIVLPLTLAVVPALLVSVCQSTFAIPLVMITETLRLGKGDITHVNRRPVTRLRGRVLSLLHLSDVYDLPESREQQKYTFAVVVQSGKQRVGLVIDRLLGEEDVVVKPLGAFIGDIPGISSAAILGDGQVALIIDVFGLFKLAGI